METLLPMRGFGEEGHFSGERRWTEAAVRAAEVFLERGMFRRRTEGRIIRSEFTKLPYPLYWPYDVLGGLQGLAELGGVGDPRASPVLDLLEARALPQRSWPGGAKECRGVAYRGTHSDRVPGGPTHGRRRDEGVTVDALQVLSVAGRLSI